MAETLYDLLYRLYFKEDDLNLFFETYRNMALNYLEKTGWARGLGYHNSQDVIQIASLRMLKHRKSLLSKKDFSKEQLASYCFGEVKYAASNMYKKNNKYVQDSEEFLRNEADNDRYFPQEFSEMALKLIDTYELENVREALKLYFFEDMFIKEIADITGLWYRGMKHLINIFIIELKNQITDDDISIEDYLKNEAPKTIFTQRRLREYIKRKTI
jgi:DNA-directed RNA polymerase specialized sigma24 family protein